MFKFVKVSVLFFLVALFVTPAVAFYDEEGNYHAPRIRRSRRSRRYNWKSAALTKTLSVNLGMWGALKSETTYPDGSNEKFETDEPDWLGSVGAKLFFYGSNWGVGLDAIMLSSSDVYLDGSSDVFDEFGTYTVKHMLVDLDLYYRLPLTPKINAIGGVGMTYSRVDAGGNPLMQDSNVLAGYNVKAGAELFLSDSISLIGMFTWHSFDQGELYIDTVSDTFTSGETETTSKLFSIAFQLNWYL